MNEYSKRDETEERAANLVRQMSGLSRDETVRTLVAGLTGLGVVVFYTDDLAARRETEREADVVPPVYRGGKW